ncbi:MAG: hypothetical protein FWG51_00650 [Firmicutes bacterium]|nr:hypothetical protein [Bacillota bacterium]
MKNFKKLIPVLLISCMVLLVACAPTVGLDVLRAKFDEVYETFYLNDLSVLSVGLAPVQLNSPETELPGSLSSIDEDSNFKVIVNLNFGSGATTLLELTVDGLNSFEHIKHVGQTDYTYKDLGGKDSSFNESWRTVENVSGTINYYQKHDSGALSTYLDTDEETSTNPTIWHDDYTGLYNTQYFEFIFETFNTNYYKAGTEDGDQIVFDGKPNMPKDITAGPVSATLQILRAIIQGDSIFIVECQFMSDDITVEVSVKFITGGQSVVIPS